MKSITEFPSYKLVQAVKEKQALVAEGKTPEEIQQKFGETFKLEGDKLKHFVNSVEVAGQNLEKLVRVLVVSLSEGETAPQKATKSEEFYYVPEFPTAPKPPEQKKAAPGGGKGRGGGGKGDGRPKGSPWGISPEEKEAKRQASLKAKKEQA